MVFLIIACCTIYANGQTPAFIDSTYKLVFADEFDNYRINKYTWALRFPWNQSANDKKLICGYGTDNPVYDQQAYRVWKNDTNNVKVSNGTVKLMVKKEHYIGEFWDWQKDRNGKDSLIVTYHDVDYTAGMLTTNKKFFRGYYEIRFKLPKAPGFLGSFVPFGANFWMYTGNCLSEIDGFEIINGQTRTYTSNIHYIIPPTGINGDTECAGTSSPKNKDDYHIYGPISDDEWHTGGFNWLEDRIDFYLDGENIYTSTLQHIDSLKPMPLIIDINAPLYNCMSLTNPMVKYPYVFEVDYVKVWQPIRKED